MTLNLSTLRNEVVSLLAVRARQRSLTLNYNYTQSLSPYVEGDPVRLKQVITNLIDNAIKFSREGKCVNIDVKHVPNCQNYDDSHVCADYPEDMTLCIEVVDSGIGIKPESLEVIFDAYDQADKSTHRLYGGTGLGLSVCKSLVELMGGQIEARSEVGVGTTFSVFLPLTTVDADTYDAWQKSNDFTIPEAKSHERVGHILLVEDDAVNAVIAKKAMTDSGHTVTHVTDGQQAIDVFAASPDGYDIILMDHYMPILDGVQATIKLHELYEAESLPPIIALTANAMEGEREKYLNVGMQDYCTKPFKKEQLNAMVQYWLIQRSVEHG